MVKQTIHCVTPLYQVPCLLTYNLCYAVIFWGRTPALKAAENNPHLLPYVFHAFLLDISAFIRCSLQQILWPSINSSHLHAYL
jgi:hypothetical protein